MEKRKRNPKINERVYVLGLKGFGPGEKTCKVHGFFLDTVYVRLEPRKPLVEVDLKDVVYVEKDKLTTTEKTYILWKHLTPEMYSRLDAKVEYSLLGRLVKKYPDLSFWRDFNPPYQVKSLLYWLGNGRQEFKQFYNEFTQDISTPTQNITKNITSEKIGEDSSLTFKPKNLKQLFTD